MGSRTCVIATALSLALPLAFIAIAIALSGWFNIYRNALSDLGHSAKSSVAPIFNFGLSLGGMLMVVVGTRYFLSFFKPLGIATIFSGYSLVLVAVFNEAYGRIHWWASLTFFASLATLLSMYIAIEKSLVKRVFASASLIIAIAAWVSHIVYRVPPGAAIPELISIALFTPFYMDIAINKACLYTHAQ